MSPENKVCLLASLAIVCLAGLAVEASPVETGFKWEPTEEFVKNTDIVFSQWLNFAGFKATDKAIRAMVAELETLPAEKRGPDNYLLGNLTAILGFNERSPEKCTKITSDIAGMMDRFREFRANLVPYLQVVRANQVAYCADPSPRNQGAAPSYQTIANLDTQAMAHADAKHHHDGDNCDAMCLGEELKLPAFRLEETEQMRRVVQSATFKQALRVVYGITDRAVYRVMYPRAMRQVLNELAAVERRDGELEEPLRFVKDEISNLLDMCTPQENKCPSVFQKFADTLPMDYEQLSQRASLQEYTKECLISMNKFCAHFD